MRKRNKEIEEMANDIWTSCPTPDMNIGEATYTAEKLYNIGYLKQSKIDWHREAELNVLRIIELEAELAKIKSESAKEVLKKIKRELEEAIKNNYEVRRERIEKHGEINVEFDNLTYGKILALDGMLGFIEHLEEEYGIVNE